MKKNLEYFFFFLLIVGYPSLLLNAQNGRSKKLFDDQWKFNKTDVANGEKENLNDAGWRVVDLPHDWSIEDITNPSPNDTVQGPFLKSSIGATATGYTVGGVAWYRKHFTLNTSSLTKNYILFDGVYMNSDVWINEHHLGNHPYGYTAFSYDITPYLKPAGSQNIIAVRVRNEGKNSRWYSGSGIYRHVWLTTTSPVHVQQWGVFISTPNLSKDAATVRIATNLITDANTTPVQVKTYIKDANGKTIASAESAITANDTNNGSIQNIQITKPHLWSTDAPYLYKAVTEIWKGGKRVDQVVNNFGIRSIEFSAAKGFLLNGQKTVLRGGCMHHDNGPLGAAAIDRAEVRRVQLLKSFGYNAVRTSHNPPSEQFLNACDSLGILVIDEAFDQWERPKNPQDYHLYFDNWWKKDIDAMVLRDRNHPSVIFWSIGNEINERVDSSGLAIAKKLSNEVRSLDATRPVTEAICDFWDHPGYKWDTTARAFALLDVGGYNYKWQQYEKDHALHPQRIMMGTESFPGEAYENWKQVEQHPWVIGDFVWTAMDYMGETGIGHTELDSLKTFAMPWPWFNAYCGDIDLIGGKKPQSYYRDIVWKLKTIAMLVHAPEPEGHKEVVSYWGWPDEYPTWNFSEPQSKPLLVHVYTHYPLVRLQLNGKTIAEKAVADTSITATFSVNYQPGELKAIGIKDGKAVDSITLQTTGTPKKIRLTADRDHISANKYDLSFVTAEVLDENDHVIPDATIPVHFSISGKGKIVATGNANPSDMQSFHTPARTTFRGRCLVIVRPEMQAGSITLKAEAKGLASNNLVITTK